MIGVLQRTLSAVALLAAAAWLGGLVALGAVVAPVVFSMVSWPSNADAMIVVFRRFDLVAMSCGALLLATEAVRAIAGVPLTRLDYTRAALSLLAAGAAVFEGVRVSPRIAQLHTAGAIRGVGGPGIELARLHDLAESCGKAEVWLLVVVVVLHAIGTRTTEAASAPLKRL
jgi:putative copper export protein